MQLRVIIGTAATAVCTACASGDTDRDTADANEGAPATAATSANDFTPEAATPPWYERVRAMDLTGDGRADTARLTAQGARVDSMHVRMVFVVDGEEELREEWGSSYELALVDSAMRHGPRADALLRARLDTVLASVSVEPLEGRMPGLIAEDSAILADFSPWPEERVIFRYGYESQPNLFWDAPRARFVRLWSCC